MFDIGFSELIVIAIVALVVIGPERLPKVARTAGHLLGRMQRYVNDVKSDISREMQLEELKKLQADMQESARSFEHSVSSEIQSIERTAQSVQASVLELTSDKGLGLMEPVNPPAPATELPAVASEVGVEQTAPAEPTGPAPKV